MSYLIIIVYLLFSGVSDSYSAGVSSDRILSGESLLQSQTLLSNGSIFELGFFAPGNSTNYFIGIWFKNISIPTVVWVANRENPIPLSSVGNSSLILSNGTLSLYIGSQENIIWGTFSVTNDDDDELNATEAILLDTGNLVVRGRSGVIWQSFDYPTDTVLPGGRVGFDKTNNRPIVLTSWKNNEDTSFGIYSLGTDGPELFMRRNLTTRYWRSGIWTGSNFTFLSRKGAYVAAYTYDYISNDAIEYFTYNFNSSSPTRVTISPLGLLQTLIWLDQSQEWFMYKSDPADACGVYETCGPFGVCSVESNPICSCLPGFVPRFPRDWDLSDCSSGCVRRTPLQCDDDRYKFIQLTNVLPADSHSLAVDNTEICEFACSINCSCNAYSVSSTGGGCLLWNGDLLDLQNRTNSRDFFLKLDRLQDHNNGQPRNRTVLRIAIPLSVFIVVVSLACALGFLRLHRRKIKQIESQGKNKDLLLLDIDYSSQQNTISVDKLTDEQKVFELPMFSFSSIKTASANFSKANKLGEGGFGPVYKGSLQNGQSVSIKRLSKLSGQGLEELSNEATLIAKLQHRNLVRLLGCCTEKDEKILIYEYMPNKSLDFFLFDDTKKELLDWNIRVRIIEGIAQELLYLHEYSRLRIVHRDLKASNILLDSDMNPKISDFGVARIFAGNALHATTHRIVGTYGYMSPEYAMDGRFSVKSDVFSFGVLLLELLSGRKNTGFHHPDFISLLGYAWMLWQNTREIEFIDPVLRISDSSIMPRRYLGVGLLCVQESPDDRPNISDVLAMLCNEQTTLPSPGRPAFTAGKTLLFASSGKRRAEGTMDCLTISSVEAR